jgi:hypothetical protein
MSVGIKIELRNEAAVQRALKTAPTKAAQYLTKGLHGGIFRLHEESQKADNLQFKKPTHTTRASFGKGIELRNLYASIRPTTYYSVFVHEGTRFIKSNPFMKRIADAGEKKVNTEINNAMNAFIKNI